MYYKPMKFFRRFLFISILSVLIVPISLALLATGSVLGYIGVLLVVCDGILLLVYWITSIYFFLKSLLDKRINSGYFIRFMNVILTTIVIGILSIFYLYFILGLVVVLLPFLS